MFKKRLLATALAATAALPAGLGADSAQAQSGAGCRSWTVTAPTYVYSDPGLDHAIKAKSPGDVVLRCVTEANPVGGHPTQAVDLGPHGNDGTGYMLKAKLRFNG